MKEQDYEQFVLSPEVFLASPTAQSERCLEPKTTGTSGPSSYVSSEKSGRIGLLEKMLMVSYQRYMAPFAPTWRQKVTRSGRFVYRLTLSVPTIRDTGFLLLATPTASQDYKPIRAQTPQEHNKQHGNTLPSSIGIFFPELIGQHINHRFSEWLMGFPMGWTDINP